LWLPALATAVFLAGVAIVSGAAFLAVVGALLLGFVVVRHLRRGASA